MRQDKAKIVELAKEMEKAQHALYEAMARMFPKGSDVDYIVKHGQINPSCGEVIGADDHHFAGYIRVRPYSGKQEIRSVHYSRIAWDE